MPLLIPGTDVLHHSVQRVLQPGALCRDESQHGVELYLRRNLLTVLVKALEAQNQHGW
jgi:hypothetical protein